MTPTATQPVLELGYLGFEVSDLARWRRFATEVLGMMAADAAADDQGRASLRLRMDQAPARLLLTDDELQRALAPLGDVVAVGSADCDLADADAVRALVRGVEAGAPADKAGIEAGDIITKFDGKAIEKPADLPRAVGNTKPGSRVVVTVFHRGASKDVNITVAEVEPEKTAAAAPEKKAPDSNTSQVWGLAVSDLTDAQKRELRVRGGVRVDAATEAAARAGIREGDVILAANGQPVTAFAELPPIVEGLAGAPVPLTVWRADGSETGKVFDITITPNRRDLPKAEGGFETRWLIGLTGGLLFEPELRRPGVFEALGLAAENAWFAGVMSLSGLWNVVTGTISSCNISGPIGMAQVMGQAATQGLEYYITMLAVMSLGIGLINLFPIPVLDGGHLVFHAYEAVFRRPPPDGALKVLMTMGLIIVLGFMAYALTNDVTCP